MDINLEHDIGLSGLVNGESLANLCGRYAPLCGTRIRVFDLDGSPLFGESSDASPCSPASLDEDDGCEVCHGDELLVERAAKTVVLTCRSGATFVRCRVDNQFEAVGHIVVGPFHEAEGGSVAAAAEDLEHPAEMFQGAASTKQIELASFLCTVIEEIVFANYQGYLQAKMTLQHHAEGSAEMLDKDRELREYEETMRQSKDLRSLF